LCAASKMVTVYSWQRAFFPPFSCLFELTGYTSVPVLVSVK